MKTSEFKKAVESLGLVTDDAYNGFWICENETRDTVAFTSDRRMYNIKISETAHKSIGFGDLKELFELLTAYASTPLDEREPERKWYLRDPVISDESFNYLKINRKTGTRTYGEKYDYGDNWQTSYTRAEIEAFTFPTEHLIEDEVSE
ncbi:hypothetical protein [Listeria newyorkensis]|uniref:hypothetical protein n=1 Tax=Listeria newyorkensis TaxID=1497681 RepID=UPI00051E01A9|nr:hypothetical protein [Listeria newyorkensis]KGL45716.1 hypothetical protein EP58_03220 [Listeria newyorkensis]SQC55351.1 Uncharacterised protein [Listeria newyorkensis]